MRLIHVLFVQKCERRPKPSSDWHNKIAHAHHKDDLIETALMSLLYEGRFYAFPPVTHLDRTF